jgi:hypothetical protein
MTPSLAAKDGDLWLMSTPFGKRGFFYETWAGGGEEWKRVKVTAPECGRISRRFLDEERAGMGERIFRREYLCEFSDVETALFDRDVILAAIRSDKKPLWPDGRF